MSLLLILLGIGNVLQAITFENKTEYLLYIKVLFHSILLGVPCGYGILELTPKKGVKDKGSVESGMKGCLLKSVEFWKIRGSRRLGIEVIKIKKYEAGLGKTMKQIGNQTIVIEPTARPKYIKIRRK